MQRYFAINKKLELSDQDIHHIINVMRNKKGDIIQVVYNEKVYSAEIEDINKEKIKINIINEIKETETSDIEIILGMALIKEQRFDLVLQKATELGVSSIIPLDMSRSIIRLDEKRVAKKLERWQKICKEAAEQSFRNSVPQVHKIMKLEDLSQTKADLKLVCSLTPGVKKIKEVLSKCKMCGKILIVVGPEGGITIEEEQLLVDSGFERISLGNLVLRSETTPISILSILNYEFMR